MKNKHRNILIRVSVLWIGIILFLYPFDGSKSVGLSLTLDYLRVFVAAGIAGTVLTLKRPKMNPFLYGMMSIVTTLFFWTLLMISFIPFLEMGISDVIAILAVTPLALILFFKKFAISYVVMVIILIIRNKVEEKEGLE